MYKLKDKYKAHVARFAATKLNINGVYSLSEWTKAGFSSRLLEEVTCGYGDESIEETIDMHRRLVSQN